MTRQDIIDVAVATVEEMRREYVPYDTGNMALNALKIQITTKHIVIYVDTTIAPYVPYTNEPWIAEKWHGTKNPNEGWWDVFAQEFIRRFNAKLGGTIK